MDGYIIYLLGYQIWIRFDMPRSMTRVLGACLTFQ